MDDTMNVISVEVTHFPRRFRVRVGMDYTGNGNITWIKPDDPNTEQMIPHHTAFEGRYFTIVRDNNLISQVIISEFAIGIINSLAYDLPIGNKLYFKFDNINGDVISVGKLHEEEAALRY